jgi:16S rRNA (guanine1207-N2)-methyltransferase
VVVNIERNRVASLGMIARGLSLLPPAGLMVLNGAKSDGIDSLARQVGTVLPLEGAFVKAHGRVVWLTRPAELPPEVAAWAAAAAPSRTADGFLTAPGLFSPEGPDPGSLRLAEAFGGALRGRIADLGAGWGWLAQAALARCPEIDAIDLYEADARALELARANVPDPRAAFHWSDATRLGRVPPYDAVIANPPFHAGRAAEPDLGRAFIAAAGRILKPSGRLLMVANRQLPYETALDAGFAAWRRLSEDGRYKVIAAERPRRIGRAGG